MYIHYSPNQATIRWQIFRGFSNLIEDFSRARLAVVIQTAANRIPIDFSIDDDGLLLQLPKQLPEEVYALEALWTKNDGRSVSRASIERAFAVTSLAEDATAKGALTDATVCNLRSHAATYGYDGLSAYELALQKGMTSKSENEWIQSAVDHAEAEQQRRLAETTRATNFEQLSMQMQQAMTKNVKSIEQTTTSDLSEGENIITVVMNDDTQTTFTIRNGAKGDTGPQGPQGDSGVSLGEVAIADNLTTDDATKVLSAKQGKELNDHKVEIRQFADFRNDIAEEDSSVLVNVIDTASLMEGAVNKANGDVLTNGVYANYCHTDLIPVTPGDIYVINNQVAENNFALWNTNRENIPSAFNYVEKLQYATQTAVQGFWEGRRNNTPYGVIVVPQQVAYLTLCFSSREAALAAMCMKVATVAEMEAEGLIPNAQLTATTAPVFFCAAKLGADWQFGDYVPFGKVTYKLKLDEVENMMAAHLPLYRKKIIAIGDSMVYGNTVAADKVWLKKIADRNGMAYCVASDGHTDRTTAVAVNAGVNGVMLSDNNAPFANNRASAVVNRYAAMDNDADAVIVFAGTNDAWALSRGELNMGDDDSNDPTEFNGALNHLMQGLLTKYPKAYILFITPYNNGDSARQRIINAIKAAAVRNGGVNVYDNATYGGIDWTNEAQVTALTQNDGVHLNEDGHAWVSWKYEQRLTS